MRYIRVFPILIAATGIFSIAQPNALAQTAMFIAIPAGMTTPSTAQPREDATMVQAVLNQFDTAVASHDVRLLQAAGIKPAPAKGWQRFFKDNPEASVTDDCPRSELVISGGTANWYCTETATIVSEGKQVSCTKVIHFTFTKTSDAWIISDRK